MSFNYAEKSSPFFLSPRSLDEHLAKGWYRMGGSVFTTHFLFFKKQPYSAIWIRVDLRDFQFSKRQRKLMRRNAKQFDITWATREIDAERESLYATYAADFDGRLSPTIADSLEDYGDFTVFDTQEVTVRERVSGQLVANSYYDIGEEAASSILGIYDPLLKTYSLGYYTMLLEIKDCLKRGLRYYYPGYVVPGYERFDYKLRAGESEYYDVHRDAWLPYAELDVSREGPAEIQRVKLGELVAALAKYDIPRTVTTYPLFEADLYDAWHEDYLPYPYLVYLGQSPAREPIVLTFDPRTRRYLLLQCAHDVVTQSIYNAHFLSQFLDGNFYTELLTVRQTIFDSPNIDNVVAMIRRGLQRPQSS